MWIKAKMKAGGGYEKRSKKREISNRGRIDPPFLEDAKREEGGDVRR